MSNFEPLKKIENVQTGTPDTLKELLFEETYSIGVKCANCDFVGTAVLKKGTIARGLECPECRCKTLTKQ